MNFSLRFISCVCKAWYFIAWSYLSHCLFLVSRVVRNAWPTFQVATRGTTLLYYSYVVVLRSLHCISDYVRVHLVAADSTHRGGSGWGYRGRDRHGGGWEAHADADCGWAHTQSTFHFLPFLIPFLCMSIQPVPPLPASSYSLFPWAIHFTSLSFPFSHPLHAHSYTTQ